MADWITVTARDSGGNVVAPDANNTYGEDAVQVDFTFSQNTTANTRAATLTFTNAIAEEKNAYNPDSPDGMMEFALFQFGKRSGNITGVVQNMCYVNEATCSDFANKSLFSNLDIPAGDLQPYTGSVTPVQLDYTLYNPSGPGVWQTNGENRQRNYVSMATGADPVPYTLTLTIDSTAPWYLTSTDGGEWLGFPSDVFRAAGSTDWAKERTYNDNDVSTPETVVIDISGNAGGTSRTGNIIFVNRQGVTNTINLNQKQYVVNNQPPNPVISGGPGVTCATSGTDRWDGSGSNDPDGTIVAHRWDPPGGGTGTEQSGHPGNSPFYNWTASQNTQCFSNATVGSGPRLYVRDDRNAANTSGYVGITGAGRATCQDSCTVNPGCGTPSFGSPVTCTPSVSFSDNSGCGAPTPSTPSPQTFQSPTCPGDTRSYFFLASSPYTSCVASGSLQFGTKPAQVTFGITDNTITNSSGSASFTAMCNPSGSLSSGTISCSGGQSNTGTNPSVTFTLSASSGNSASNTCTCSGTDNASPAQCRQAAVTKSVTFTYTNPDLGWSCNGDGTCSLVAGGSHSTEAACLADNCDPPPNLSSVVLNNFVGASNQCTGTGDGIRADVTLTINLTGQNNTGGTLCFSCTSEIEIANTGDEGQAGSQTFCVDPGNSSGQRTRRYQYCSSDWGANETFFNTSGTGEWVCSRSGFNTQSTRVGVSWTA